MSRSTNPFSLALEKRTAFLQKLIKAEMTAEIMLNSLEATDEEMRIWVAQCPGAPDRCPVYDVRVINELLCLGYTEEQLAHFGAPPAAAPGFITYFDSGLSICALRTFCERHEGVFNSNIERGSTDAWYLRQEFALKEEEPQYRQIRMDSVPDSRWMGFPQRQGRLPPTEIVPDARRLVMAAVVHFLSTEKWIPTRTVYCADTCFDREFVHVSSGGIISGFTYGLEIHYGDSKEIGLASEKILNQSA